MDQCEMNYVSKKNPVSSKQSYKILLKLKTENLIQRMIWKALVFLGKTDLYKHLQNYGFYTKNFVAVVEKLTEFEYDLQLTMKTFGFKKLIFFSRKIFLVP